MLLTVLVASCMSLNDLPTITSTPTPTKNNPITPTSVLEVTPMPTEIIPQPDMLSTAGPWLVYSGSWDKQGLESYYISNLDGRGKIQLFSIRSHTNLGGRLPVLAPNNAFLSCQSMKDLDDLMGLEKEIVVFQLPSQGIVARIPVVDTSISNSLREIGKPSAPEYMYSDEFTSIMASGEMLWSPNSRYLAYTAAVDGPTSDVYVFDTETLETKRLTDGSTQASLMDWSPDSRWVVHYSWNKGDKGMAGALPKVNAIWAVGADSGEIKLLENVEWESIDEIMLGWSSHDTFVTVSREGNWIGSPSSHIRSINITSNTSSMLYKNEVESVAYDPKTQSLAFTKGVYTNEEPGLYLLSSGFPLEKIDNREWVYVNLIEEIGWFTAMSWHEERKLIFSPQGSWIENYHLEKTELPRVSPNGQLQVFIGKNNNGEKGIRIYNEKGELLKHILPHLTFTDGDFYWKFDGSGFWFVEYSGGFWDYGQVIEYSIYDDTLIQWLDNPDDNFDMQYIVGLIVP